MEEIRLFRVPAGYQVRIRLEAAGWWSLVLDRFYEGEPWDESDRVYYDQLSLEECADCVLQELFTARP